MDQIKKLLKSTGLSADDLIRQLAEYKALETVIPNPQRSNGAVEATGNKKAGTNGECQSKEADVNLAENGTYNSIETFKSYLNVQDRSETEPSSNSRVILNDTTTVLQSSAPENGFEDIESIEVLEEISHECESECESVPADKRHERKLQITDLIKRRLQAPPVHTVDLTEQNDDEEETICVDKIEEENVKKQPTLGCLRKRSKTKDKKKTKPPWMLDHETEKSWTLNHVEEPDEVVDMDSCEDIMREKIVDQIMRLRKKRELELPLVSIVNSIPKIYIRRPCKPASEVKEGIKIVDISGNSDSKSDNAVLDESLVETMKPLPIQIVEVRSGISENAFPISTCNGDANHDVHSTETCDVPDKNKADECEDITDSSLDVINKELESHAIKVTKTQDFTKIKGWRKKKLLIHGKEDAKIAQPSYTCNAEDSKVIINIPVLCDTTQTDPTASCSYTPENNAYCNYLNRGCATDSIPTLENVKQTESKNIEDITLSVFASNNLEGFLKQTSLNISYTVPNLKSSKHSINLLDDTVVKAEPKDDVPLGDKKRRYTMAENEETNTLRQNDRTDVCKPRTLAEKRKLLESTSGETTQKKRKTDTIAEDAIYSTVYFKGRKISVRSRFSKTVSIDAIKHKIMKYKYIQLGKRPVPVPTVNKRKPSIYASVEQSAQRKPAVPVSYKPGPLCKKESLQITGSSTWKSVLKTLPRVYVDVKPRFRKPVHPKVRPFVKFQTCKISVDRAEFALSALRSSRKLFGRKYSFRVPYSHDQESVLLRKRLKAEPVQNVPKVQIKVPAVKEDVGEAVGKVLDDLITCIENSEIENSIIKMDEDFKQEVDVPCAPKSKVKSPKNNYIKGSIKKTNAELRRLNVKVIEVNIEEDKEPSVCTKAFCKFGCVCKSLSNTSLSMDHCGQARCIFKCHCGFEQKKSDSLKFILPSGTDLLSERTVSRLRDEAKKDLARVEAEFTQTVIHANKTIVFGDNKDRKRRPSKFPKRYEDYIETNMVTDESEIPLKIIQVLPEQSARKPVETDCTVKPCSVQLLPLNLEHLIPFCLVHNLYDCHCNGSADYIPPKPLRTYEGYGQLYKIRKFKEYKGPELPDKFKQPSLEVKPKKVLKSNCTGESSARVRGTISPIYHERNKTARFKKKLVKMFRKDMEKNTEFITKWLGNDLYETPEGSPIVVDDEINEALSVKASKPNRRKQLLHTREDGPDQKPSRVNPAVKQVPAEKPEPIITVVEPEAIEPAIQRRNKRFKKILPKLLDAKSITDTGLVGDSLKQMLGQNNGKNAQFRLLQWSMLMERYEANMLHIWFVPAGNKLKFVITETDTLPGLGYKNIRDFEQFEDKQSIKVDLIRWVVSREVPGCRQAEDTLVILRQSHPSWEISGICAKNCSTTIREMPHLVPQNVATECPDEITKKTQELIGLANDKYKASAKIIFANHVYIPKKLAPMVNQLDPLSLQVEESASITVALPTIQEMCRWRAIKLNSSFSILSFSRNSYRIKCSDIITVMKVCQQYCKTVSMNSQEVAKNYSHSLFGIYMCPNHSDKIFVGPYFDYENDDLETLRFVNNILVNTDLFNKMRGNPHTPNGTWYKQIGEYTEAPNAPCTSDSVIDLTEVDECPPAVTKTTTESEMNELLKKDAKLKKPVKSPRSLLKLNLRMVTESIKQNVDEKNLEMLFIARVKLIMKLARLELPEAAKVICFKVNFDDGLIHGYELNGKVHVCWPGDRFAIKTFSGTNIACDWLKMKLNTYFILLPTTFQIQVSVVQPEDYSVSLSKSTISSKYFLDVHIVGDFGILRALDIGAFITDKLEAPNKATLLPLPPQISSSEKYKASFLKFLTQSFLDHEVLEKSLFQLKFMLQWEKKKESQLNDKKKVLEQKKFFLLKQHTLLFKNVDNTVGDQMRSEFMEKWTSQEKTPYNLEGKDDEVICLDSDEEPASQQPPEPFVDVEKLPEQLVMFTIDSNRMLHPVETDKTVQTPNAKSNPASKKVNRVIPVKRNSHKPSILVNNNKIVGVFDNSKVEKIDLSNLSTEKVSSFLGANIMSSKVMLTKAQLNSLKVLSGQQKGVVGRMNGAGTSDDPLSGPT